MENGMSGTPEAAPATAAEPVDQQGLETYKRMLTDALTLTDDARKEASIDQDYFDGYQWTPEERRVLRERKQPDLVFNRVRPAVNGTLGVIQQGETDPRAYPRTPKDEGAADTASKTLRFIADKSRFSETKMAGAKDYLVPGTCAAIVEVVDGDIVAELIRFEEFFYDPRARKQDLRDARYMGVAKWVYSDDLAREYPDQKAAIDSAVAEAVPLNDTMRDRPSDGTTAISWTDKGQRRVMVVEMYHLEGGVWQRCLFFSGAILARGASPYLDEKKRPTNPIEAQSCYVDRENNRYGIVRDMRGPQDEINKRRSKLLQLVSTRQVQAGELGGFEEEQVDRIRAEAARPDGVLPFGAQVVPTTDMASGQANLLGEAKGEIERMGPNPAVLGRQGQSSSGRAQLIRQQAGLTEQATIFGGIEDWELRLYRQMWMRARQYWTAPMWVRITDDEGAPAFIGLNQPVIEPNPVNPMGPPVQRIDNPIADLDVDIILDSVPDTANVQAEQFALLVELARSGVDLSSPMGRVLFEASSLPNKREILDKLGGGNTPADPAAQQAQAAQTQIAMRGAVAKVAETEASAALKGAQATETQASAALKGAQAQQTLLENALAGPPSAVQPPPGFFSGASPVGFDPGPY